MALDAEVVGEHFRGERFDEFDELAKRVGLYDESAPHTCGAKDEVKPSIMANQWKATEGDNRFDWLNLSIARNKGGDFEIERSTCQYFAYSAGAWPVLARTPDEDPRDGTSMKFQTLGPRIFYPELALVAPTGTTRRRLDLPSPMAQASLDIIWMASRTVIDIVLDRSGSMAGPKLAKAKAGRSCWWTRPSWAKRASA